MGMCMYKQKPCVSCRKKGVTLLHWQSGERLRVFLLLEDVPPSPTQGGRLNKASEWAYQHTSMFTPTPWVDCTWTHFLYPMTCNEIKWAIVSHHGCLILEGSKKNYHHQPDPIPYQNGNYHCQLHIPPPPPPHFPPSSLLCRA